MMFLTAMSKGPYDVGPAAILPPPLSQELSLNLLEQLRPSNVLDHSPLPTTDFYKKLVAYAKRELWRCSWEAVSKYFVGA